MTRVSTCLLLLALLPACATTTRPAAAPADRAALEGQARSVLESRLRSWCDSDLEAALETLRTAPEARPAAG